MLAIGGIVTLLLIGAATTGYLMSSHLPGNVERIEGVFDGIDNSERPEEPPPMADGSVTFLLVGSDSRTDRPSTGTGTARALHGTRTDTIMLIHLAQGRRSAYVISIPRDAWVSVPGRGQMKINGAFAVGGPTLLVRTVERLTRIRINHFGIIDFHGFRAIVDAVGGVDVPVKDEIYVGNGLRLQEGVNHLDGAKALDYVRQRYGLPQGDLDRVRRQQNLIRAVIDKVGEVAPVKNPVRTYRLLDAITKSVTVDKGLTDSQLRSFAFSLRDLRRNGVTFLTAPVRALGLEGEESVVYLNEPRCAELWKAIKKNAMSGYLLKHKRDSLAEVPR